MTINNKVATEALANVIVNLEDLNEHLRAASSIVPTNELLKRHVITVERAISLLGKFHAYWMAADRTMQYLLKREGMKPKPRSKQ